MGDVADVRRVLFLDCPADVLRERLLSRGLSSGRTDDNLETANRRLQTFVETTLPVSQSPCLLQLVLVVVLLVIFIFYFFCNYVSCEFNQLNTRKKLRGTSV